MARWERFARGADVGVRGFGASMEQAKATVRARPAYP
jgi:hypothetical protein